MALLRWEHQWGGVSKKWMERYRDTGREPPAPFGQRTELDPALDSVLTAFYDLCTERQIGMTLGPIPHSKIRDYAERDMGLDGEDAERAIAIIKRVDGDYLQMMHAKTDSGPAMRDMAAPSDVEGTRRVFSNLAKKPKRKALKPNG